MFFRRRIGGAAGAGLLALVSGGCLGRLPIAREDPGAELVAEARRNEVGGLHDPCGPVGLWGPWVEHNGGPELRAPLADARLSARRDLRLGLEVLEREMALRSQHPALLAARGTLLAEMGFLRAGEQDLEHALRLRPDTSCFWWALGEVRRKLRLLHGADEALARAYGLGERHPALLLALAEVKGARGDARQAAVFYARRAWTLESQGQLDLARHAYEEALRVETDPRRREHLETRLAAR